MKYSDLRVLFLPINYMAGGKPYSGAMCDAWDNVGVQWKIFDFVAKWEQNNNVDQLQKDLIKAASDYQPHIMHMQLQYTGLIRPETLKECRKLVPNVIMSNWTGDIRANVSSYASMASSVDFSLISSTGQLELYRQAGCHNVGYWQIGYDPKITYPMNLTNQIYDCTFIGHNYGANNIDFGKENIRGPAIQKLHSIFGNKFGLFGNGFGQLNGGKACSAKEMNQIYNESLSCISISNINTLAHYFSDRLLFCLASGRPTISWAYPECEDDFIGGKEILYVKSNDELVEAVHYLKNNPDIANQIGQAGYQRVLNGHTYTHRAKQLLQMLGFNNETN